MRCLHCTGADITMCYSSQINHFVFLYCCLAYTDSSHPSFHLFGIQTPTLSITIGNVYLVAFLCINHFIAPLSFSYKFPKHSVQHLDVQGIVPVIIIIVWPLPMCSLFTKQMGTPEASHVASHTDYKLPIHILGQLQ